VVRPNRPVAGTHSAYPRGRVHTPGHAMQAARGAEASGTARGSCASPFGVYPARIGAAQDYAHGTSVPGTVNTVFPGEGEDKRGYRHCRPTRDKPWPITPGRPVPRRAGRAADGPQRRAEYRKQAEQVADAVGVPRVWALTRQMVPAPGPQASGKACFRPQPPRTPPR
jgi:hypothetical protein